MNHSEIEAAAYELQAQIWTQRHRLWPKGAPTAVQMLEPEIGALVLGIRYDRQEEITTLDRRTARSAIAGLMDRQASKIVVSERFGLEAARFTGAHELGHWKLHPSAVMHRDFPLDRMNGHKCRRAPQEEEADYFAGCFLMPPNLLRKHFEATFLFSPPFVIDDSSAFWLSPSDPDLLLNVNEGSLDREIALATTSSYKGRQFVSLAKQFRVSPKAMAIRLQQLDFVKD